VQEANLAVPFAFGKLGASGQAAEYYEQALTSFADESGRIDRSIQKIQGGQLLAELLKDDAMGSQRGWFWQLKQLPDAPESRYLYPILASNDFQEGLKNVRDLAYLRSTLARWDENMGVYTDMVEARERAYAERTPRVDAMLASQVVADFDVRRQGVEARFNDILGRMDQAALGTDVERSQSQRIEQVEAAITADPNNPDALALKDKLRLAKGVLQWNLQQSWRARVYAERRNLRQLDQALDEVQGRWLRVQRARETAPTTTGDFATRIADLQGRLTGLRAKLLSASAAQEQFLADRAIAELQSQKSRMAEYEVQARFELASLYDRAAEGSR
jgi:chromosome segregation ATPase